MAANRQTRRAVAATAGANPHRGEAALTADGVSYKLKMTLNALVEIEEAFDAPIGDVAKLLNANMRMKDLRKFLGPLVRGGGNDLTDEEVGALPFGMGEIGQAIRDVLRANLTGDAPEAPEPPAEGEAPALGN